MSEGKKRTRADVQMALEEFFEAYCKKKGWATDNLTTAQVYEILSRPTFITLTKEKYRCS